VPGYIKGILIALVNTVLIAIFIGVGIDDGNLVNAVFIISFMGFIPAVVIGGLLGHYGETMQKSNRHVILIAMIAVASTAVAMLGLMFDLSSLVLVSCIPTAANCSVLERWTRAKAADAIPLARVA
jgi:hypothetical protein